MPPRKAPASDSADASAPTRRSARISTQSKPEPAAATKRRTTTKNNTKKRSAEAEPGEGEANAEESSTNKKAKPSSETQAPQSDETQDKAAEGGEQEEEEALQPIDIGGTLPTLTLKNEKDEDVQVADLAAQRGVVMFLVPKADTPGCTTQACGFRDVYSGFTEAGYDVYCLSADAPAAQTKWQTKKELPYHLLSDRNRILIGALGAGEGGKTKRSHFIFEKGGVLVEKVMPVKPNDSSKLALEFIKGSGSN
ncbi:hypothetical protein M378DRAFT_110241 [Amanita muscaria Koide BX008]|uniref:thioredoxin-dependent peroxiredoxin n=1 Tax=Amanita muscaria (strain Koide BX008) TaxID=946122 RepID=A0A0C2WU83_AMAMK|nr:hypothetical protein M378DRAFT_110241 [Amanita muscaria Koide BX008]